MCYNTNVRYAVNFRIDNFDRSVTFSLQIFGEILLSMCYHIVRPNERKVTKHQHILKEVFIMKTNTIAKAVLLATAAVVFPSSIIASANSDKIVGSAADVPAEIIETEQSAPVTETDEQSETVSAEINVTDDGCVTVNVPDESVFYCYTITRTTDENGEEKTVTSICKDGEEPHDGILAVEDNDEEVSFFITADTDETEDYATLNTLSEGDYVSEISRTGDAESDNDIQYSSFYYIGDMTDDMSEEDAAEFDRINGRIAEISLLVSGGKVLSEEELEAGYAKYQDELDGLYDRLGEILEKYMGAFDLSVVGMEDEAV